MRLTRRILRGSLSVMAAVCEVCGKKPSFGMNISHSHRRTKRRWDPEHPAGPGPGRRLAQAPQRLHVVHPIGQGRQATGPGHPRLSRPAAARPVGADRRHRTAGHARARPAQNRCRQPPAGSGTPARVYSPARPVHDRRRAAAAGPPSERPRPVVSGRGWPRPARSPRPRPAPRPRWPRRPPGGCEGDAHARRPAQVPQVGDQAVGDVDGGGGPGQPGRLTLGGDGPPDAGRPRPARRPPDRPRPAVRPLAPPAGAGAGRPLTRPSGPVTNR